LAALKQRTVSPDCVDGTTVLAAARRAGGRAITRHQKETLERTTVSAEKTLRRNLEDWDNPSISGATLRDELEPALAQSMAEHTAALRANKPVEEFAAAAAESSAGRAANVASRKAGAAKRDKDGFSATYVQRVLNGAGGVTLQTRNVVQSGAQVRAKRKRDRAVAALPDNLRPTYGSQTTIGHGMRSYATGRAIGGRVIKRPPAKRSRAEIVAQAQTIYPMDRGRYYFKLSEALWSDWELGRMGFRPVRKPKRTFYFSGPTAKADAEAFERTMMKWLKDPNRDGPPPQPRKP